MTDIGHTCRAKGHCVAKTSDGPAVTSAPNTICHGCVKRLQFHLDQLPHLRDALASFKAAPLTAAHGSKVNSSPTPSVPINLTVVDLISEIGRVITIAGGPKVRIVNLITEPAEEFYVWRGGRRTAHYLDGVDHALAIGDAWRKADNIVGLSRQWVKRQAPCLRCGQQKLGMFVGEDTVYCTHGACNKFYTLSEYENLCIAKAALERIEKKEKVK